MNAEVSLKKKDGEGHKHRHKQAEQEWQGNWYGLPDEKKKATQESFLTGALRHVHGWQQRLHAPASQPCCL